MTGITQYAYDPSGNTTAITIGAPGAPIQTETRGYDALDELITDTVQAAGQPPTTTLTSYDPDGNVVEVQQPNGDVTFNSYDTADQLLSTEIDSQAVTGPTGTTQETYQYDPAGNVTGSADFDGRQTTTQYDAANRVTQQVESTTVPTGTTTITTTPSYDPNGNVVTQTAQTADTTSPGIVQTHTYTAAYNSLDQLTSSGDDGLISTFGVDAAGRTRTLATLTGGTPVTLTVDALGRGTAIAEGTGTAYTSLFGYTADSRPLTMSLPGTVSEAAQYDPNSELTHLSASGPSTGQSSTTLSSGYDYAYNAAGWITALTSTVNGAITGTQVTHNALGRVTAWTGQLNGPETWQYDGNGNIISGTEYTEGAQRTTAFTYSATQPNELLQQHTGGTANGITFGTEYYQYDHNGNTTSITSTDAASSIYHVNTHLTYDGASRPITITALDNLVPVTISLAYNAQGLRSRYTVTMSGTVVNDEHFQYQDGLLSQVVAVTATLNGLGHVTSSGAYTDTYVYGPRAEPLELLRQSGGVTNRYWYVLDGQANVVALTDVNGHVVDRYAYDLWGELLADGTSESVPQQVRYRGYWFDSELGWYWLDTRSYDPEGHFLQPDPTTLDGIHTYVYAEDDPVDLMEVGGATGIGDIFHAAVDFVQSAAHVVYKIAETVWDAVAGQDIHLICCTNEPILIKALAGVDLALNVVPGADAAKPLEFGAKVAGKVAAERGAIDLVRGVISRGVGRIEVSDGTIVQAIEEERATGSGPLRRVEEETGCTGCFPAATRVATPHGEQAIQTLHVGDQVLAEDPQTGKVEAKQVQGVIQDPVSPLIAVQLSDGSAITVTADHPFWVESGAGLAVPGWLAAGRLRVGDALRTASGRGVMVMGLRWQAGRAAVYALTVAKDHTFFVGAVRVLVHNCDVPLPGGTGSLEGKQGLAITDPAHPGRTITDIDLIEGHTLWELKSALYANDPVAWAEQNIAGKFARYLEARQYLPQYYRNAAIGFRFESEPFDPAFMVAVETEVARLRAANPGVTILLEWGGP